MKRLVLSFIFLYFGAPLWAQSPLGSNELSLDEAIRIALDKNYDARSAQLQLKRAEVGLDRAEDNLLPDLALSSNYSVGKALDKRAGFFGLGAETVQDATHSNSWDLGGSFNIYAGGQDAATIRSARYSLDASKYGLKWARQSVAFSVTSAYVNALRTRELLNASDRTLAESKAQLDRVRGLYEAGSIPIGQVYQQEALVGQQELASINAKNDYDNARTDLFFLLNMPQDALRYDVSSRGIDTTSSTLKSRSQTYQVTTAAIDDVLGRREDFLSTRTSILASEAAIDATKAQLLPQIDLNYGIGGLSGAEKAFDFGKFSYQTDVSGSISFRWTLFERNQIRLGADLQEIDVQLSRVRLEQEEQSFKTEVVQASNTLRSAELALDASERALKAAEESARLATERVRVGAGIQVDVIVAQSQLQSARTNRVNAVYNYVFAQKQLEYLLGRWNY